MKTRWLIFTTILLLAITGSLQAMPESLYFVQDDFIQTFGATGNPGSADTEIHAWGKLVRWNVNQVVGFFDITCKTTYGAVENGSEWITDYDQGTITISSQLFGAGTIFWSGNIDSLVTRINSDGSAFDATVYDRPSYDSQPTEFRSVGSAQFSRTSGSWTDNLIGMSWFGTYDWNFDAEDIANATWMSGNLEGQLVAVPEPSSFAACVMFLTPLVVRIRKRQ